MKCFIVHIPASLHSARTFCESIEGLCFEVSGEYGQARRVQEAICAELGINVTDDIEVEPITDFMDRVNDEDYYPDDSYISYVYGKAGPNIQ